MKGEGSPADLVQAASLLVAGLAVVYGLWYPRLEKSLSRHLPEHEADAIAPRTEIRDDYRRRALPLFVGSALTVIVFVWPCVKIAYDAIMRVSNCGLSAFADYNAVEASLVLVLFACIALSWHVGLITWKLRKKAQSPAPASDPQGAPGGGEGAGRPSDPR
jgi:hypothetical protein